MRGPGRLFARLAEVSFPSMKREAAVFHFSGIGAYAALCGSDSAPPMRKTHNM
jgi:hypothetical protein